MCWIFDYPTNCTGIMTNQEVEILISIDTPGKVVQGAIFFLATQEQGKELTIRTGATKAGRKRKKKLGVRNNCPSKQFNTMDSFSHASLPGLEEGNVVQKEGSKNPGSKRP